MWGQTAFPARPGRGGSAVPCVVVVVIGDRGGPLAQVEANRIPCPRRATPVTGLGLSSDRRLFGGNAVVEGPGPDRTGERPSRLPAICRCRLNQKRLAAVQRLNSSALALNLPQNDAGNETSMKKQAHPSKGKKPLDYPEETNGTRWAAEARKQTSKMTRVQRAELFRRGMVRIHGGQPKEATGAGH